MAVVLLFGFKPHARATKAKIGNAATVKVFRFVRSTIGSLPRACYAATEQRAYSYKTTVVEFDPRDLPVTAHKNDCRGPVITLRVGNVPRVLFPRREMTQPG